DEPTTGLDATTQKAVMDIIRDSATERGLATILITHDLGLAAQYCERLAVMKLGQLVESGQAQDVLHRPQHEYTRRLVAATPRLGGSLADLLPEDERINARQAHGPDPSATAVLETINLRKTYRGKHG